MNSLTDCLKMSIKKQLRLEDFDLVDCVPIPAGGDWIVKLKIIEEILDNEMSGYLIQIRPKIKTFSIATEVKNEGQDLENIYLADGKLNYSYLIKNAELLFQSGEYLLARKIYKALEKSGDHIHSALLGTARSLEAEKKYIEAIGYYEESIAYHPTFEAYNELITLLIQLKKDQQAAELIERTLNLKEISLRSRFELHKSCGNCWTRLKNLEKAESHYRLTLEIECNSDEIRTNLGFLYLQESKTSEAKSAFQEAIALNPKNHQALTGVGLCALAEGNKRLAHDFFVKTLEIKLNNPTAIFYLVRCAYEIKSFTTATRLLEEYVETTPVNVHLLYSLAGLQFHSGRLNDAKTIALKILELSAQYSGAIELLKIINQYEVAQTM